MKSIKNLRLRYKILFVFIGFLVISNILLYLSYSSLELIIAPHDVDRKVDGNTLITSATYAEMLYHPTRIDQQKQVEDKNPNHKIFEVDKSGKIKWEYYGVAYPHEVLELPNGHLLVADTGYNRIIEINYPEKDIVWSWEPAKINWTQVNPKWDEKHYYNSPENKEGEITYDWTHVNDVDYKDYGQWSACLISIRNFDLVVEVNYSADLKNPNQANNINWYFGDFGDHDLLYRQHNPDYLKNGNVIIADSANNRIIEVNYTTKKVEWEYSTGLQWPRDADELENGDLLITDSFNCRVFELDKKTKEIKWSYSKDLIIPYEADKLENGNVLISSEYNSILLEIDGNQKLVWRYGLSYIKSTIYLNSFFLIGISVVCLYLISRPKYYKELKSRKAKKLYGIYGIFITFLIIAVIMLIFYSEILISIARIVYTIVGAEMY